MRWLFWDSHKTRNTAMFTYCKRRLVVRSHRNLLPCVNRYVRHLTAVCPCTMQSLHSLTCSRTHPPKVTFSYQTMAYTKQVKVAFPYQTVFTSSMSRIKRVVRADNFTETCLNCCASQSNWTATQRFHKNVSSLLYSTRCYQPNSNTVTFLEWWPPQKQLISHVTIWHKHLFIVVHFSTNWIILHPLMQIRSSLLFNIHLEFSTEISPANLIAVKIGKKW
jgi:hypothetical protein